MFLLGPRKSCTKIKVPLETLQRGALKINKLFLELSLLVLKLWEHLVKMHKQTNRTPHNTLCTQVYRSQQNWICAFIDPVNDQIDCLVHLNFVMTKLNSRLRQSMGVSFINWNVYLGLGTVRPYQDSILGAENWQVCLHTPLDLVNNVP